METQKPYSIFFPLRPLQKHNNNGTRNEERAEEYILAGIVSLRKQTIHYGDSLNHVGPTDGSVMKGYIISLVCVALSLSACSHQEAYYNAGQVRNATTGFYNDEVMRNLIYAYNHELFIHADLSSLQPTITTKFSASVGGGQTLQDMAQHQTSVGGALAKGVTGLMATAAQTAMRPFTFSVNPERDNALQITLQPQYGNDTNVYSFYFQYLSFTKRQHEWEIDAPKSILSYMRFDRHHMEALGVSPQHPKPGTFVQRTLQLYRGNWYYIPTGDWPEERFWELCMLIVDRPSPKAQKTEAANASQSRNLLDRLNRNPVPAPPSP